MSFDEAYARGVAAAKAAMALSSYAAQDAETSTAETVGDGDAGVDSGADRTALEADGEGVVG